YISISILIACVAACTSVPQPQQVRNNPSPAIDATKALVVLYREDRTAYDSKSVEIGEAGRPLALLPNASCQYLYLEPGKHSLQLLAWNLAGAQFDANWEAGHIYYLKTVFKKFDPHMTLMEVTVVPVEPDAAKDEIGDLQLLQTSSPTKR
ncbi:MAG TPA: hypothetical protein VGM47_03130, partial [Gammaproteobacteria bacterium]